MKRHLPMTENATKTPRTDDKCALYIFAEQSSEWFSMQKLVRRALSITDVGSVSKEAVQTSMMRHKEDLEKIGYMLGTYYTDLSLFEKIYFQYERNGSFDAFRCSQSILRQVNEGSKPGSFSMLVFMEPKYLRPLANMAFIISHDQNRLEDFELFWELTDRLWCFGHPLKYHSDHLDETCSKINQRALDLGFL